MPFPSTNQEERRFLDEERERKGERSEAPFFDSARKSQTSVEKEQSSTWQHFFLKFYHAIQTCSTEPIHGKSSSTKTYLRVLQTFI